jgi:hypothetical protein
VELAAQSHCLALCTNLVMAYNTSALQRTIDIWRKTSGREIDASIQRFISPMGFGHINFNAPEWSLAETAQRDRYEGR